MAQSIISKGGLSAEEAESIALASSRKLMVILDDKAARSFAEIARIAFLGTAGLLFQAFVKKHLTPAEQTSKRGHAGRSTKLLDVTPGAFWRKFFFKTEGLGPNYAVFEQEGRPVTADLSSCAPPLNAAPYGRRRCCAQAERSETYWL
ncbi:MAG: hypothetical protein JO356_10265 [Acidobacteria bacterium]|nr:hypothetical protein [Acidobacteriota bacterium]